MSEAAPTYSSSAQSSMLGSAIVYSSFSSAIKLRDEISLYYKVSLPRDIKALIIIVHGVCEHSGRYNYLCDALNDHGYGTLRFDLRGHGISGGEKGVLHSFHEFSDDLSEIVDLVKAKWPDTPVVTLGHSLGALVSLIYELEHPGKLVGQVLSAGPVIELPLDDVKMLKVVPYEKMGALQIANRLGHVVSRDPAVVADYGNDPLNIKTSSVRLNAEMFLRAPVFVGEHVSEYTLPCLMLHGSDDKIVTPHASEWLNENISSTDKTLKFYPGLYHEIYNEKERDTVITDTIEWLDKHIS